MSIDAEIKTKFIDHLVNDIKDFSGPFLKSVAFINVEQICDQIVSSLPEKINLAEILLNQDANEKENIIIKNLIVECTQYNDALSLINTDISCVIACKNGDTRYN